MRRRPPRPTPFPSPTLSRPHGSAGVDAASGQWSYTASDAGAVDALAAGEHLADSFTVKVDDGHGGVASQLVTIDIAGTNDAPLINSATQHVSAPVTHGGPAPGMTSTGQVTVSDLD